MKGLVPVAGAVIGLLVVVLVAEALILNNLIARFETVRRTIFEIEIVQAINVLESLRTEVRRALDFSFYQALYDVAAKGGYPTSSDCTPHWRLYSNTNFPEKFLNNIQLQTQGNLNVYGNDLENKIKDSNSINVDVPSYIVALNDLDTSTKLTVTADDKLVASKTFYTISNNPNFEKTLPIDISKIYDISKIEFVDKDPIKEAIINVNQNQMTPPAACKLFDTEYCEAHPKCQQPQSLDCETLLTNNCKNADEVFKSKVKDVVINIGNDLSNKYTQEKIRYEVTVSDSRAKHETKSQTNELVGDQRCGCKVSHIETFCPNGTDWNDGVNCKRCPSNAQKRNIQNRVCLLCTGNFIPDNPLTPENEESCDGSWVDAWVDAWQQRTVCDVYCKRFSLKCTYDYSGAVSAQTSATDLTNKYPVYDKTTDFRNIKLQFFALSSNDPSNYKPIDAPAKICS